MKKIEFKADDTFPWGKYKGKTVREVFSIDKRYIDWINSTKGYQIKLEPLTETKLRYRQAVRAQRAAEGRIPAEAAPLGSLGTGVVKARSYGMKPSPAKEAQPHSEIKKRIRTGDPFAEYDTATAILMNHQRAGSLLADRFERFAYFYDTGTGKTVMALEIMQRKHREMRVRFLVVAPKAVIKNAWMDDARMFFPQMKLLPLSRNIRELDYILLYNRWNEIDGAERDNIRIICSDEYPKGYRTVGGPGMEAVKASLWKRAEHFVINAELFREDTHGYCDELGVSGLVLDESAILKTYESKTSQRFRGVHKRFRFVYLLSGKPAPNNNLEYYTQMKIVDPVTFAMPFAKFKDQFFVQDRFSVRLRSKWAANELAAMVAKRSLIITKEDCLTLPPTTHVVHGVELSPAVMKQYDDLLRRCFIEIAHDWDQKGAGKEVDFVPSILGKLMKLREVASGFYIRSDPEKSVAVIHHEKQKELLRILRGLSGDQAVIWCQYRYEIETLEQLLSREAPIATAYGGTKDVDRSIERFRKGEARYILAHPQTLKYGVTFTNCHYAVYYSMSYSHEDYYQSHDRIYRKGQSKPCTFLFIQAADTIDEVMHECVMGKKTHAEMFEKLIKQAARHGIDYGKLKPA